MNTFPWLSTYSSITGSFHSHSPQPLIGITGNYSDEACTLAEGYSQSVLQSGCIPFIIPPFYETDRLASLLDTLDGIIFSGGGDINPILIGEEPIRELHSITP